MNFFGNQLTSSPPIPPQVEQHLLPVLPAGPVEPGLALQSRIPTHVGGAKLQAVHRVCDVIGAGRRGRGLQPAARVPGVPTAAGTGHGPLRDPDGPLSGDATLREGAGLPPPHPRAEGVGRGTTQSAGQFLRGTPSTPPRYSHCLLFQHLQTGMSSTGLGGIY